MQLERRVAYASMSVITTCYLQRPVLRLTAFVLVIAEIIILSFSQMFSA